MSVHTLAISQLAEAADALYSQGGYMTGQRLYEQGIGPQFSGYVIGIHDADQGAASRGTTDYCVPDVIRSSQLVDIVYNYLKDHPGNRDNNAAYLVRQSFRDLWPCTRKR